MVEILPTEDESDKLIAITFARTQVAQVSQWNCCKQSLWCWTQFCEEIMQIKVNNSDKTPQHWARKTAVLHCMWYPWIPVAMGGLCENKNNVIDLHDFAVYDPCTVHVDWSLRKLFGRSIKSTCPLASTSKVYLDISNNKVLLGFLHVNHSCIHRNNAQ